MARHTGEGFINVESIAISSVLALQSACMNGAELDAPETDRLPRDDDSSLNEQFFNIAVPEDEATVEPDSVGDDIWRESVTFLTSSYSDSTSHGLLTWQYPVMDYSSYRWRLELLFRRGQVVTASDGQDPLNAQLQCKVLPLCASARTQAEHRNAFFFAYIT